jgi:4-hydroxy-3-methylbut-2-en-1-yl diphosphate synthase IspG/GcpE
MGTHEQQDDQLSVPSPLPLGYWNGGPGKEGPEMLMRSIPAHLTAGTGDTIRVSWSPGAKQPNRDVSMDGTRWKKQRSNQ